MESNSERTRLKVVGSRRSYPAAKTWQVSRQTPMRDLSLTREIMSARSVNVEPITLPEPAIVSRSGTIDVVAAWAAFRWEAMRAMAARRGEGPVEPGLYGEHGEVGLAVMFCSFLLDFLYLQVVRKGKEKGDVEGEGESKVDEGLGGVTGSCKV